MCLKSSKEGLRTYDGLQGLEDAFFAHVRNEILNLRLHVPATRSRARLRRKHWRGRVVPFSMENPVSGGVKPFIRAVPLRIRPTIRINMDVRSCGRERERGTEEFLIFVQSYPCSTAQSMHSFESG